MKKYLLTNVVSFRSVMSTMTSSATLHKYFLLLFFTLTSVWVFGQTAVYTVATTSSVTKTGTAPTGSSATYSQTYLATPGQITSGNSTTLSLSSYSGYKITSVVLNMKSNASTGAGNMTAVAGSTTISSIATNTFANASWNGAYSTTYVNVTKTPTIYNIGVGENVVITITGTTSSLYISSYSITYAASATTAITSGNWSSPSTWSNGVPTSSDNAIIASGQVVTMDNATYATRNSGTSTVVNLGGTLATNTGYTNNGSTTINGTFQLNVGGYTNSGNNFVYGAAGTLNFNSTSSYATNNTDQYWPTTSGPYNVTILQGGITLNAGADRTVAGTFQTAAGVTLSSTLTLNGICQINFGGFFNNTPTYGSASTLIYNSTFGVDKEWTGNGAAGVGIPANLTVQAGTLSLPNVNRGIPGNISINTGTTLNLNNASGDLYAGGNMTVAATGNFNSAGRAVFFNGSSTQTISKTGGGTIGFDYFIIDKTAGNVVLSGSPATDITVNASSSNVLQIINSGGLDLNGRTLAFNNNGGGVYVNGSRIITSSVAGGNLDINQYKYVSNNSGTGTLTLGTNVTLNLNTNGNLDFGKSGSTYITTLNGILSINSTSNCFVNTNPPIYGTTSLLKYNSGSTYGRSLEWSTTSGAGYPNDVQVSNSTILNYPNTGTVAFSTNLTLARDLTIDAGSALYLDYGGNSNKSGSLTVGRNVVLSGGLSLGNSVGGDLNVAGNWTLSGGAFTPNSRAVQFNGFSAQTITGATTFDYLTLNNSFGLALQTSSGVTVNQTLALTSGKITLAANNLTIGSGGTITGAGVSNYIIAASTGQLKRTVGGTSIIFPVGNTAYNPITFNNSGTSDIYGVRVLNAAPAGANNTKTVTRQWITTEAVAGGSNLSVVTQYNTGEIGAGYAAATDSFIGIYNGTSYSQVSATQSGSNPFTVDSATNLSPPDLTMGTQYFAIGRDNGLVSVPSKYLVSSITPASPIAGSSFSAAITAQDAYGSNTTLSSSSSFSLTSNGNAGIISGTTTGTVASGQSSVVVSGINLPTAGTGVTLTATTSSGLSLSAGTSASFIVLGVASKLVFSGVPSTGTAGINLTSFTVEARRPDNSVDTNYAANITISKASGTGNLTGTLSVASVAGKATFSSAQFDVPDTYTLTTTSGSLTPDTSGNIVISPNPANAYFRSNITTGSWSIISSWQSSTDGSTNWVTATVAPNSAANVITIRNGNNIILDSNVTLDQLVINNGGQLTVDATFGTLNINDGTGTDVDIQSGGIFQVITTGTTSTYANTIIFMGSSSMNVNGKITVGDGSAIMGGGYGAFGFAVSSQIIWNNNAILEWNTTGSAPGFSAQTYFPGASSAVIPIFRITKIAGGQVGGSSPTIINGLLQLNGANLSWQGTSSKIFRNGITSIGTGSMSMFSGSGTWQIGDPTVTGTAEIGGISGNLTLSNINGISLSSVCSATLTGNTVLSSGTFTNNGTIIFGANTISGGAAFTQSIGATIITSNSGGVPGSVAVSGTKIFSADGANYTFNAATTTPFFTGAGQSTKFGIINTNADVSDNISGVSTFVTTNLNVNSGIFSLNSTASSNLNLSNTNGIVNIAFGATFDSGGENNIISSGGTPGINILGTFITRDAQGFTGTNTAIPTITPSLGANSTIVYGLSGDQTVTDFAYQNLTFSGSGIKTSGTVNSIAGTVTINTGVTLDSDSKTFGGSVTKLNMVGTSIFKTGGSSTKPDAGGTYTLDPNSTIEFQGSSGTLIRLNPQYGKVVISGSNVSLSTVTGGLTFQSGGTFTVKDNATFKVINANGFSGGINTAIKSTNSPSITLDAASTIEYSGTADQIISKGTITSPTDANYQNLRISGSGVKTASGTTSVKNITYVGAAELLVPETALDMDAPNVFYAAKGLQVTSPAIFHLANNSNLMQNSSGVTNIGNIVVDRKAKLPDNGYNYWSAPVAGQLLHGAFSGAPSDGVLEYNEATDYFVRTGDANFAVGKSYAMLGVGASGGKTFSFTGTPNNANISTPTLSWKDANHGYNLIGNPYPSNLNFNALYTINSSLMYNTAYFWTNNTYKPNQQGSNYDGANYAILNGTGGDPAAFQGGTTSPAPTASIKPGQGFIIQMKSSAALNFDNTMRVPDGSNFFNNRGTTEKDRFHLTLTTPSNINNVLLIGYIQGASDNFEQDFDAELIIEGSDSFYSKLGNIKLAIQGKGYPLVNTDIVPLGAVFYESGLHKISLSSKEGVFNAPQAVYLRDNLLGQTINLSTQDYSFSAVKGTYENRFQIVYQPASTLSANENLSTDILIYQNEGNLIIKSTGNKITKVEVFDNSGKISFTRNVSAKEIEIPLDDFPSGVYLVKIKQNYKIIVKKIIK